MGALYGFDLLLPRARLSAALTALAARADAEGFTGCTVVLPDGVEVATPFDGCSEDGPVERFVVGRVEPFQWLDASLWLPVDARVRSYVARHPGSQLRTRNGGAEAAVGLISVHVHPGVRFALVRLGAVTAAMSHVFADSAAVRGFVQALLVESGGLVALLSRERGAPFEPLDRPTVRVEVDDAGDDDDPAAVDCFVDAVLRALGDGASAPG